MKRLLAAAALAVTAAFPAAAEWSPPGPIKLLIAFAAGGGADTQARLIAEALEAGQGWQIIPEQLLGKGGTVLARELMNAPGDGTVIGMVVSETYSHNMLAAKDAGFTEADVTFITTTAGSQMGIVAKAERGWKTLQDVVDAMKAGQTVSFGAMSAKLEDGAWVIGQAMGVDFNIVSFKGGKEVMDALVAGDIDIGWVAGVQAKGVLAGDLVNLASGEEAPLAVSPDAPTLESLGIPYDFGASFMLVGPPGMSDEARDAIAAAVKAALEDPDSKVHAFVNRAFSGPKVVQGDALEAYMARQIQQARNLIAAAQ
jgi:tripartite-type tricarboxylate transporter receptor subunit TctC